MRRVAQLTGGTLALSGIGPSQPQSTSSVPLDVGTHHRRGLNDLAVRQSRSCDIIAGVFLVRSVTNIIKRLPWLQTR